MSMRLETRALSKNFGTLAAVSGVSFSLEPGLIHAVLGENGAGKSTLMKLLFGLETPTSGEILLDGEVIHWRSSMDAISHGLGMVQQHFSLVDTLSAIDNIMLGAEVCSSTGHLDRKGAIAKIEKLLPSQSLAVPWETKVGDLKVGQKQRVEILKLLFREAKILFLDEPTAVLTPAEIEDLFSVLRELRNQGRTVVLITHKIKEVLEVCDTFTVIRSGHYIASGRVSDTTSDTIVEHMIGRRLPEFAVGRKERLHTKVLEVVEIHEVSRERGSLKGISLEVHAGEILGVAGVEGSGQGNLVEAVFGLRDFRGALRVLGQTIEPFQAPIVRALGAGLVPEDRLQQGLWLEESCFMNMVIGLEDKFLTNHIFDFRELETATSSWAREYDVRSASLHASVGSLSGGNQQKVLFAREVTGRKPKLLVCHQPTRGVDLGAIDLIHRKLMELRNQGLGILMLSSELDELIKLCDRIVVLFEGRVAAEFNRAQFDRLRIGAAMTGASRP
jgi:ABC-type uncharacterized transport system ATPase subunit